MEQQYTYAGALAASERVRWRLEALLDDDTRFDFSTRFMPEGLAQVDGLDFLTPAERRTLNQIRGHTYLNIFGVVEEFILPFVLDHARPHLHGDDARVRALLAFAGEEAKHIHLFKRFRDLFQHGFGTPCATIGPAPDVARAVLAHHPLAVALTILHIEWMTQRHWIESVQDDAELEPSFKSLLRHHWMEEAQHAKLDTLMVESIAAGCSAEEIAGAVEEYLAIGGFLDEGLTSQVTLDREALERATGRVLTDAEREAFIVHQQRANRWTYLGSGMTHPRFLATLERLDPSHRRRIEAVAPSFC
jgi:hypothetical protein